MNKINDLQVSLPTMVVFMRRYGVPKEHILELCGQVAVDMAANEFWRIGCWIWRKLNKVEICNFIIECIKIIKWRIACNKLCNMICVKIANIWLSIKSNFVISFLIVFLDVFYWNLPSVINSQSIVCYSIQAKSGNWLWLQIALGSTRLRITVVIRDWWLL